MGLKNWIRGNTGKIVNVNGVGCPDLGALCTEFQIRNLAFATCVGMIANAVSKCEFRTFAERKEVRDKEYFLWNVRPNANQNSTAFVHHVIHNLFYNNKALIVEAKNAGSSALIVADSWNVDPQAVKPNLYTNVRSGTLDFNRSFRESDVLHLQLNHVDIKPILDGMTQNYIKIIAAVEQNLKWSNGKHWKVKVDQIKQNEPDWEENFRAMIESIVRPFFNSDNAVLPEFAGYEYSDVGESKSREKDRGTRDIRALYDDIFDFTARTLLIPPVLLGGQVEGVENAMTRFMTFCVDPACDQWEEEINGKRFGFDRWRKGDFLQIDTSKIIHFDLFQNASNIEKLIGSGFSYNDIQRSIGGVELDEEWAKMHWMTKNFALAQDLLKGGEDE